VLSEEFIVSRTDKNSPQSPSSSSKPKNKTATQARIGLMILMGMNFLLVSYIGLIFIGFGAAEGAFGLAEWIGVGILALLMGTMIFSFIKPLHSYAYFILEIPIIVLFWLMSGGYGIPLFFFVTLVVVAIPYLIFLRSQAGEWTKSR
jgi:hypothetical protein